MILRRSHITMLVISAVGALVMLIALPDTGPNRNAIIDRHTGRPVLTAADHIRRARDFGDAALALGHLDAIVAQHGEDPDLAKVADLLRRELAAPAPWSEPTTPVPQDADQLLAWLDRRVGDADQSAALERLFAQAADRTALDATAARLALHLRGRVDVEASATAALELADRYQASGRQRAAARWWRQAWSLQPDRVAPRAALANQLVAAGALRAAREVAGEPSEAETDDTLDLVRAQLDRWLDHPTGEVAALERMLARDAADDAAGLRARAMELWLHLGEPRRALPHAMVLQAGAGAGATDLLAVAELAFVAGAHDAGFELLARRLQLLRQTDDLELAAARRAFAEQALSDLRIEAAITALRESAMADPWSDDADRLHGILRRTAREGELVDLLERRLAERPTDDALRRELIARLVGLGRREAARELLLPVADPSDPTRFMNWLPRLGEAGIGDLDARLASCLAADDFAAAGDLPTALAIVSEAPGQWPRSLAALEAGHLDGARRDAVIALLITACDAAIRPSDTAAMLGALSARHPRDEQLLHAAIDRAAWTGDRAAEIDGRRRLRQLDPADHASRGRLALLLAEAGQPLAAAAVTAALVVDGPDPLADLRHTARHLSAAGQHELALEQLVAAIEVQPATAAGCRAVGDDLFAEQATDLALQAYERCLELDADDAHALLRCGQIHAWNAAPDRAVPLFERRLSVTDRDAGAVHFQLAEARAALGNRSLATHHYRRAAELLGAADQRDLQTDTMLARALAHTGRHDAAAALLQRLLAVHPDDPTLCVELVAALAAAGRRSEATPIVERALHAAPHDARVLRTAAAHHRALGDTDRARELLTTCLLEHGADASLHADLAGLDEAAGSYRDALHHIDRWVAMQPSAAAAARQARLWDRRAGHAIATIGWRAVGDDRTTMTTAAGSVVLDRDPEATLGDPEDATLRLDVAVGHARFDGVVLQPTGPTVNVETETALLDLGLDWRIGGPRDVLGFGLSTFPGADGAGTVGGFVALHRQADPSQSFWSWELRAFYNELWSDPAGAPGLAGRQDGVESELFGELGNLFDEDGGSDLFGGLALRYRRLGAQAPGQPREYDGRIDGQLTLGARLLGTDAAVADFHRVRHAPSIPNSPYLDAPYPAASSPDHGDETTPNTQLLTWLGWQSIRQLDDAALATLLPIGEQFDYAVWGLRGDTRLARGWGASATGFIGYETHLASPSYGVELTTTWRPRRAIEATLRGGYGSAIGRAGSDENSLHLLIEGVVRW